MASLFDDIEFFDDLHEFDDHAIWLAEVAARDEGYPSLFSAAQHCALDKVDPSSLTRIARIPVASRMAIALCYWYNCKLHEVPQYLRGGYLTDDGNILVAAGYGYDVIDKDMLGNGDGVATRMFEERYDYLLRAIDEQGAKVTDSIKVDNVFTFVHVLKEQRTAYERAHQPAPERDDTTRGEVDRSMQEEQEPHHTQPAAVSEPVLPDLMHPYGRAR
ncbi:hypothetical protein GCM10007377_12390 [Galliscardovia ingluviei]|uniref:Uncharacterized protein n=1 Tax=Galliscardovia ingluviei TaxID=1769422 RepID=A0A8J3APX8_9BIFI|nr:hypothetical protein [Galliscardovia ingluviei]GGI14732.1 hypothetical protein GCM10007377_12390 [Galliscardovia ingluviei]